MMSYSLKEMTSEYNSNPQEDMIIIGNGKLL